MPLGFKEDNSIKDFSACIKKYGEKAFWDDVDKKCYDIDGWQQVKKVKTYIKFSKDENILGIFRRVYKGKYYILIRTDKKWYAQTSRYGFSGIGLGNKPEDAISASDVSFSIMERFR